MWKARAVWPVSQDTSANWPRLAEAGQGWPRVGGRPPLDLALVGREGRVGRRLWTAVFHMLVCSKRENVDVDENLPGSTTPCMGTAEKAASSRGVRGDLGPTPCSISRWLKVVDGVKGSSGRREGMATPQVPAL